MTMTMTMLLISSGGISILKMSLWLRISTLRFFVKVKTTRALQYFPTVEDPSTRRALFEVLQCILMGTDVVKNVNKINASHAVLFEALALVGLDEPDLLQNMKRFSPWLVELVLNMPSIHLLPFLPP